MDIVPEEEASTILRDFLVLSSVIPNPLLWFLTMRNKTKKVRALLYIIIEKETYRRK